MSGRRRPKPQKGREFALTEIKLKKGEPVDRAQRCLKKKIDREGERTAPSQVEDGPVLGNVERPIR